MDIFYNATSGPVSIPSHGGLAVRELQVGESFYGTPFYEKYVKLGVLAKIKGEICIQKGFVGLTQFSPSSAAIAATSVPHRYKTNSSTSPTDSLSCYKQMLYMLSLPYDSQIGDSMQVTYYFYTSQENPTQATDQISRIETIQASWNFPSWIDLPSNFHSLSPLDRKTALMASS